MVQSTSHPTRPKVFGPSKRQVAILGSVGKMSRLYLSVPKPKEGQMRKWEVVVFWRLLLLPIFFLCISDIIWSDHMYVSMLYFLLQVTRVSVYSVYMIPKCLEMQMFVHVCAINCHKLTVKLFVRRNRSRVTSGPTYWKIPWTQHNTINHGVSHVR